MQRIERLKVNNFQSISNADLELGSFTVIVGPSNSGKSALLRALRAVVRNVNSPSAVRVGHKVFTAAVEYSGHQVSIERGKSQSTYRAVLPSGSEEVYTKAGRAVPEDVQKILDLPLPEGPDLVFSTQIDPPFLLAETGSVAAKMLGDLTNVSKLHAAAKEANRRRLEASKIKSIREEDALATAQKIKIEYADLLPTKTTLSEARELLESVREKARKRDRLNELLADLSMAESALTTLEASLKELPEPADIEALAEKAGVCLGKRHMLLDAITTLEKCVTAESQLLEIIEEHDRQADSLDEEYRAALVQAGECPTCGQKVSA